MYVQLVFLNNDRFKKMVELPCEALSTIIASGCYYLDLVVKTTLDRSGHVLKEESGHYAMSQTFQD